MADPIFKDDVIESIMDSSSIDRTRAVDLINSRSDDRDVKVRGALLEAKVKRLARELADMAGRLQARSDGPGYAALLGHLFGTAGRAAIMASGTGTSIALEKTRYGKGIDIKIVARTAERAYITGAGFECKSGKLRSIVGGEITKQLTTQAGIAKVDEQPVSKMFTVTTEMEDGRGWNPATWPDGTTTILGPLGARTVAALLDPDESSSRFTREGGEPTVVSRDAAGRITGARWLLRSPDSGHPILGQAILPGDGAGGLAAMVRKDAATGEIVVTYDTCKYTGTGISYTTAAYTFKQYTDLGADTTTTPEATRQAYAAANGLPASLSNKEYAWAAGLDAALVDPMNPKKVDYRANPRYVTSPTSDAQRASNLAIMRETDCWYSAPVTYARGNGLPETITLAQYNLAKALDATLAATNDQKYNYKAHKVESLEWTRVDASHPTLTQAEMDGNLMIMLDCAMTNLFGPAETVSFSLGFVVGGPHARFQDMARRFRYP